MDLKLISIEIGLTNYDARHKAAANTMHNQWRGQFKVKVLSFKKRFCNGDSEALRRPATAYAQTLAAILLKMIWILVMFSIWFYPVIAFYIVKGTRDNLGLRRKILIAVVGVSLMAVLGLLTGISTTSLELDTIFVTSLYLLISMGVWIGIEGRLKLVRAICIALGVIIFGLGYFSGTIGAIGVGFIAGSFESSTVKLYDNGIIYKEKPLGNAISDFRGKEVEVYRTIGWLPIIEWRLTNRKYYNIETYRNPLQVEYLSSPGTFILSLPDSIKIEDKTWVDTLSVE